MNPLRPTELSTRRLHLRPLRDADAEALLPIFANPNVVRYGTTPPWDSIARAFEKIARSTRGLESGEALSFGVFKKDENRLIGTTDLFQIDARSRRAEIGYSLAEDVWGQGYTLEAVTAVLDHAFSELGLNRIEADIDPRNTASVKCVTRLGFTREGLLRQRWIVAGQVSDSAMYGLLRDEWLGRRPAT